MARKALGRGIGAIISEVPLVLDRKRNLLMDIELDKISANPSQPRGNFDPQALEELSRSINERGVLQPVVVRQTEEGFQLIIGERRTRAAKLAGKKSIPAIVLHVSQEREMLELALVENLQREDLNPMDEARAYKKLIADCGLTQKEVSQKVGKDRASVANAIRLLKLPEEVQDYVVQGSISAGHARALLALDDPREQRELAKRIAKGDLSVRTVERMVQKWKRGSRRDRPARQAKPPEIRELEEKLQRVFGTAVNIVWRGKRGTLEIEFYSNEDLERILAVIEMT
ncbi:ParB/RepB/Spo0J family partition protein [bacterium]|nr:ParB/RepB/Spo0J family partition protein [bacterium]